jgi:predicted porin
MSHNDNTQEVNVRKKILVAAVSTAFVIPAACAKGWSDKNVVELYGKVYPEIVRPHGSGATDAGATVATLAGKPTGAGSIIERNEMESSNSRFGIRGQEKLARDLKAIFQLETQFHVDSNDSAFATRNSFVGLAQRRFGTIKLGRMDTPFKKYGDELSLFGISSGNFVSSSNVFRKTGFGTNSASSFHLRRANAIQYETPVVAGFNAAMQYSTNEADTASRKPHVWSGGVQWGGGPVKVALAYEEHWDLFGGSRNVPSSMSNFNDQGVRSRDKAVGAMVQYRLGHHTFEADWNSKKYDENATLPGRFRQYKNTAYEVKWDARWTRSWRTALWYIKALKGSCSRVDAACSTDGLEGSQLNLGVAYYFSPQTFLYAIGAILQNGSSARFNNEELQDPSVGEDVTQWALGLNHTF